MIVGYMKNGITSGLYTIGRRGQAQSTVALAIFQNIGINTDICFINQPGKTFLDIPVRLTFVNIILKLIAEIINRNVKRVGVRRKADFVVGRKNGSEILLTGCKSGYFDCKGRNFGISVRLTDIGSIDHIRIAGISRFLLEHFVISDTTQGNNGVTQETGIFF